MTKRIILASLLMIFFNLTDACEENSKANQKRNSKNQKKVLKDHINFREHINSINTETTNIKDYEKDNVKIKNQKTQFNKDLINISINFNDSTPRGLQLKQDSLFKNEKIIPKKWLESYSLDLKWMNLYEETSRAFLKGWSVEFSKNPSTNISKEEIIFAYRCRLEKIFFEIPSFIEFCCYQLKNSNEFNSFVLNFQNNLTD
jgi:hypothetical protein